MKNVKVVKTVEEMRRAFNDEQKYTDKYIVGTYNFLSELYDMRIAPKFNLANIFDRLNKLTLKEEFIIMKYYGIGRPQQSIEEIAKSYNIAYGVVKAIITRGKKHFMECAVA